MTPTSSFDSAAFLRGVLAERCRTNPRYSMRAFAKSLGLSPGGLSLILSRKKRLSTDRAHEIVRRMGLATEETESFLLQVELESASSPLRKSELMGRLNQIRKTAVFDLGIDQFRLISEWYGLAVLAYFTDVSPPPSRIAAARSLGISVAEVDAMLDRLTRLELIEPVAATHGRQREFRRVRGTVIVEAKAPSEAMRNYNKAMLVKAQEAIESQGPDERVSGSQVFAFDPAQFEAARKLTDRYLSDLNALAERGKKRTQVYQAITHLFRAGKPIALRKAQS